MSLWADMIHSGVDTVGTCVTAARDPLRYTAARLHAFGSCMWLNSARFHTDKPPPKASFTAHLKGVEIILINR